MPMVTLAMLALIGLTALGLESGVLFWDTARLQNATDAAALSAAKVLDDTRDTALATNAGIATFNQNAAAAGNAPLNDAVTGGLTPTFQYSSTLNPFTPGAAAGPYVRAAAAGFIRQGVFSRVFGISDFEVRATAVSGPSPTLAQVCDIAPVMVCGDPANNDADTVYGYDVGDIVTLKLAAGHDNTDTTPGNFFLIRLGASGANVVRSAFAGEFEQCTNVNGTVDTEPGNEVGPVRQGVDTRFVPCRSPIDCDLDDDGQHDILPDNVTTADISFATYEARHTALAYDYAPPNGLPNRRILKVPIADCTGMGPGATSVQLLTIACFFLRRPVPAGGTQAQVTGEFLGDDGCTAHGFPGPNPGSGPGPYIIQLYKDPDGTRS